jgi:hypothetical protein
MNRKGDVTTAAPVLTGSEYNSTLTNGVLRVQATSGMMILKPITAPLQLAARLGDPRVSADHYVALQITDYNTAINNTSQRVAAGYTWGKYVYAAMYLNQFWYTHRQQVPPATDAMYVFTLEAQEVPPDSFDWRNAVIDPYSGRILWSDPVPLSMLNTPISYGGLEVLTAAAAFSWVEIDYVRQYPYGAWFPT